MSLTTQHEFLFVGRDEGSFVENYAYDIGEGGDQSGKIFINIELQNNPADAELIGELIFDSLRKAFFADLEKDPYERFEDAVRSVNKGLQKLRDERNSAYLGDLHVLVAAIVDNTLYLTQTGEAEAYLIRKRLVTTVSEGLGEDNAAELFTNIASGSLEPGDMVLLSSTRLLRYMSKTDLAKVSNSRNLVASLGELRDYLMTEVLGRVGFIGVAVNDKAPGLTEAEQGQVMSHLHKEESYSREGRKRGKEDAMLQATLGRLTDAVYDLRDWVKTLNPRSRGKSQGAIQRGSDALRKDRLLVGIIVGLLILTLGVWWLRSQASEQEKIQGYAEILQEVQASVASAETTGQYNKEQAGNILQQAEQKALEVLNSGYHRAKANEMLQSIQDARDLLDGVARPDVRVLADLQQKRETVNTLGLLGLNDTLYAFEYNALYPIVLDEVQDPLTIDDNETIIAATVYEDEDSLLFYTESGKLMEFKDNRVTFVDTADGAFRKGVAVQGYSNKFYVLDPEENQIWRYTRRRDQFDAAEAYNVNSDLSNGVSLAIDGNIYILNNEGTIQKIFSGNKESFPIKKAPTDPLEQPTKIYTKLDLDQIYVLEPAKRRVLVYIKDDRTGGATYHRQLLFEDYADLRDLYVDPTVNKLYLADKTRVYEVTL